MEFITVEQFKEQPEEVQKVFLDWWKPSVGDIYSFIDLEEYSNDTCLIQCLSSPIQIIVTSNCKHGGNRIPLFTEGQLRKFIEDKTGFPIQKIEINSDDEYDIYTVYKAIDSYKDIWLHDELGTDLLQAYWKVACIVAKEGLNG